MNDQMLKLKELNIPSCCLNSTVSNKNELKDDILQNKYRVVLTTPEFIVTQEEFITELYDNDILCLIAIDEAHVVSTWAQDFRVSYTQLSCLREWFPDTPIMALTATATKKVQNDIVNVLQLNKPLLLKTTFDRPNLNIKVMTKGLIAIDDLLQVMQKNEPTIVYCQTRKQTDKLAKALTKNKIVSKSYHAGMNAKDRNDVHEEFAKAKLNCVVATIAFGMGIDVTIRKVIHYGLAKDMESYYQEIGRAGRDGKPSECYMFYALSDMNSINFFLNKITNTKYRSHMLQLSLIMKNYIFSSECRRKYILEYFGEEYTKENCGNCDNCCSGKTINMYDFAKEAKLLFNTLNLTGNSYGALMLINILRGANSKKIHDRFKKSDLFGAGKHRSEQWWRIFVTMLVNNQFVKEQPISGGHAFTLAIAKKASEWLGLSKVKADTKMILAVPDSMQNLLKPVNKTKEDEETDELEELIESVYKPKKASGKFMNTYELFHTQKKTMKQVGIELDLNIRTVEEHLVKAYELGEELDLIKLGLTNDIYNVISKKIVELGHPKTLSTVKNALPHNISYMQIKLSMAKMNKVALIVDDSSDYDDGSDEVIIVKPKKKDSKNKYR